MRGVAAPVQLRRQHGRSGLIRQMWSEPEVWLTSFVGEISTIQQFRY